MQGVPITLTTSLTAYNLYTLSSAVDSSIGRFANLVILQNTSGTAKLFVGGSNLSSTKFGNTIAAGGSITLSAPFNGLTVDAIYLLADVNGTVVNVLDNSI